MRELHVVIKVASALFTLGLFTEVGRHALAWPVPPGLTWITVILAGFAVLAAYYTKYAITQFVATAAEVRKTVIEENKALFRSIMNEIDEYGKRREIQGHLTNERHRIAKERAGEVTVEIGDAEGPRVKNVTPLLRKHG